MELKVESGDIAAWKGDGIVVNLFEGVTTPGGAAGAVDKALNGLLTKLIAQGSAKVMSEFHAIIPFRILWRNLAKVEDPAQFAG